MFIFISVVHGLIFLRVASHIFIGSTVVIIIIFARKQRTCHGISNYGFRAKLISSIGTTNKAEEQPAQAAPPGGRGLFGVSAPACSPSIAKPAEWCNAGIGKMGILARRWGCGSRSGNYLPAGGGGNFESARRKSEWVAAHPKRHHPPGRLKGNGYIQDHDWDRRYSGPFFSGNYCDVAGSANQAIRKDGFK